jgi:hypothetical protein
MLCAKIDGSLSLDALDLATRAARTVRDGCNCRIRINKTARLAIST